MEKEIPFLQNIFHWWQKNCKTFHLLVEINYKTCFSKTIKGQNY